MIQAESDTQRRDEYLQRLMELPNQARAYLDMFRSLTFMTCDLMYLQFLGGLYMLMLTIKFLVQKWAEIIGQARQSVDFLKDQDVIRAVLNILQVLL